MSLTANDKHKHQHTYRSSVGIPVLILEVVISLVGVFPDVAIANPSNPSNPSDASNSPNSQMAAIANHLIGVMDTSAQAAANPKRAHVRMTTCPIQVSASPQDAKATIYLYQEQALAAQLNQPYRQRILRITPAATPEAVESKAFKPLQPESLVGLCQKPEPERIVPFAKLQDAQCSVFLKPYLGLYVGETQPGGCPTNVRGAVTITNFILLHASGMDTQDRGFDAQGHQVWGAENEAYKFRWLLKGFSRQP